MIMPSLAGHVLISMPSLEGDLFRRSIIYVCEHNEDGAMGLVINQEMQNITFANLLENMKLIKSQLLQDPTIYFGGPVETGKGFILHTSDVDSEDTIMVKNGIGITATVDMVEKIARGVGPTKYIFALGYAGWSPDQLENEILNDLWISVEADEDLIFDTPIGDKRKKALAKLGISPEALNVHGGRA